MIRIRLRAARASEHGNGEQPHNAGSDKLYGERDPALARLVQGGRSHLLRRLAFARDKLGCERLFVGQSVAATYPAAPHPLPVEVQLRQVVPVGGQGGPCDQAGNSAGAPCDLVYHPAR